MIGTVTPASGTVVSIFVQNTDTSLYLAVDRIYVQPVTITGGTAIPNTSAYISLGFGRTYSSGGTSLTPVNLNKVSTKTANVTTYSGPTLAGTFTEAFRWYVEGSSRAFELIPQEGDDIILGRNNTIEIRYTSDNTAGTILTVMKFFFTDVAHSAP